MTFFEWLADFNAGTIAIRLVLALLCGGIIGMERGRQGRAAGMRTHILVCLGSALTVMIGIFAVNMGYDADPLRIGAQVVSGIGFLGVGSILVKGRFQITGLTTSAGLWCSASIGLALGIGFYEGAFIVFLFAILTVTSMHKIEYKMLRRYQRFGVYVEIKSDENIKHAIDFIKENFKVTDIQVTAARSNTPGNVGIEAVVHAPSKSNLKPEAVAERIEGEEYVVFALESI